jgi:hypothetical protein
VRVARCTASAAVQRPPACLPTGEQSIAVYC